MTKDRITIIMPTYKRNEFLSDLEHPTLNLTKDEIVKNLIIIWNNINEDIPNSIIDNIKNMGIEDKVIFKKQDKNSLNNRFNYYNEMAKCLFSIDDDYVVPLEYLYKCFETYLNNKDSLIGVVPRNISNQRYIYDIADGGDKSRTPFNFLLTGGLMYDRKFLEIYNKEIEIKDMVDSYMNGEDISFNFIHRKETNELPIYVHIGDLNKRNMCGVWRKYPDRGLSMTNKNHTKHRLEIFNKLFNIYGDIMKYSTKIIN